MAQLPQDLIEEILSWLPVKSLMRFRCVSRTWNSLIFQAHFVKLNLQRSSRNTHVLLRCQINTVFEDMRDLPGIAPCSICSLLENPSSTVDNGCHQLDNRYLFIGSCNGLVCLINLVARGEFSEYRVWFCNLATRIMSEDLQLALLVASLEEKKRNDILRKEWNKWLKHVKNGRKENWK